MTLEEQIKQLEKRIKKDKRELNRLLLKKDLRDQKILGQISIDEIT